MSDRIVHQLRQRLSLRTPQADSLAILAELLNCAVIDHNADPTAALTAIQNHWPQVADFERDFPSICFALATGVGKTRLMGAFIAYLALIGKSRHFLVLAPNTTIYQKLINDFTPGNQKYVFTGIPELAQHAPLLITGDNYENGRAKDLLGAPIHINIFNIGKIDKEESPKGRPRMRRLQETLGESYYDYLAGLTDLVLIMDEAHRYRASAGAKAIDGLKPILGLELTATPKTVGAHSKPFQNVIYRYDLSQAINDGLVKEPAVATRKDFDPKSVSPEHLERIKLEDAVHHHDHVAVELERYHHRTGQPQKHPFILVVAQDTDHARQLRAFIESAAFFEGRFKDKVIEVHSAQRGEESEEALTRLIALEQDGRTEIVIHVNKLKEGWDVNNLYTIVPLRASASDILTEQTLGRGLRLPYGIRLSTSDNPDFAALDRLTVIAHDRFDDVIQQAKQPGSILMQRLEIGEGGDIPAAGATLLKMPSVAETMILGNRLNLPGLVETAPVYQFKNQQEQQTTETILQVIPQLETRLSHAAELRRPEIQRQIAQQVRERIPATPDQPELPITEMVARVANTIADRTISIPQLHVFPKQPVSYHFPDFDLTGLDTLHYLPLDQGLVIQDLRTHVRTYLDHAAHDIHEAQLENALVRYLKKYPEIDYEAHADLLYKLAGQIIKQLRAYLNTDAEIANVLLHHGPALTQFIFTQMKQHLITVPLNERDYEVRIMRGFTLLQPQSFHLAPGQQPQHFRQAIAPLSATPRHLFHGFSKCCYPLQQFDSDPERRFAALLETDSQVEKWLKPARGQFQIEYRHGNHYEPDFVIETRDRMLIGEVKDQQKLQDSLVQAKQQAAIRWCWAASQSMPTMTIKPWFYLLIPDDLITGAATIAGLSARCIQG